MNQPIYYDHGINIEDAAKIRKEISVPVTVVGSVTLEQAEQYIAEGKADMVSMARGLMADPMVVKNAKSGCPENTRPCVRCNYCINRTHYDLAPVRCSVNAELGMETLYMNLGNTLPKRIAVIGGGPAGIEAARTAAQRGHTVDLYEKEDHLGGVLTMAGAPKFKQDIKKYVEWTIHSISGQERVSVHLNSEVRAEDLKGKDYDAVIVAIGANPAQTLKALREAESYDGPSLIIAYAPCINHGIKKGMNNVQQEMKDAVNSGYWNLYRYSPETKKFTLDSKEPSMPLYDFMKGEVRYASLELSFPENAKVLFKDAEEAAKEKYEYYKRKSEN